MLKRAFLTTTILMLALVIVLTIILISVQARHNRIIEGEIADVLGIENTYQASLILEEQRRQLSSSVYQPIDRITFTDASNEFRQLMRFPALQRQPGERETVQHILAGEQRFTQSVLALPTAPTPGQVQRVQLQAEQVADLLDDFRTTHRVNLHAIFDTERQQRDLLVALLLFANGVVLALIIGGVQFLARVSRLEAEALALRSNDQLRSEFISFAAHELRNPASAIKTGASMLRDQDLEPDIYHQVVDSISRSADALSRLVLNLLNIGRIEAGELRLQRRSVKLDEMVTSLIAELEVYHPGITHRIHVALPSTELNIDEEYIKLAISNILDNAIKYSPPGGAIEIEGTEDLQNVIVHIRDSGAGIPHDLLPYIFDKYETSGHAPQSARRGIGLGLYMTRLLIEAHGGRVWAESVIGQGTTISFSLPCATVNGFKKHPSESRTS